MIDWKTGWCGSVNLAAHQPPKRAVLLAVLPIQAPQLELEPSTSMLLWAVYGVTEYGLAGFESGL